MNDIHFHLLINHFPIVGAIFALVILITGIFAKNELLKRMAYGLFIITALLAIPTKLSGEKAEHHLKKAIEVNDIMIEKHESMADLGFWSLIVLGLLSIIAFYLSIKNSGIAGVVAIVILLAASISVFYLWQTGESGGKIRHTESFKAEI